MIIWMAGWGQICDSIIRLRQESLSLVRGFAIGQRNVMGGADGRPSRYTSLSLKLTTKAADVLLHIITLDLASASSNDNQVVNSTGLFRMYISMV
jgi:hypothetical protein